MNESGRWQFWIDRGGTFTDVVAKRPDGKLLTHKLLSDNPERYQDAALQGIRDVLEVSEDIPLAGYIDAVKMGTTVGTNALLERKGEPVALLITCGFKDCLRIGYQNRPDIFALDIRLPEQLYQAVVEIDERIDARGTVLKTLDAHKAERQLQDLYDRGFRSIAIVSMHAWRYPEHEIRLASLAERIGFTHVSVSHRVSPLMKIVGRGDTAVVDAYLSPLLQRYVDCVAVGLNGGKQAQHVRLMFMQSNGGLTDAKRFRGRDCILSGPAGGIVGAVAVSKQAGFDKIIAFDMGGTSTDVAHYAGEYERNFETEVAGVRMRVPMMAIHTVAAGGGSILHFDGMRYRVGPDSAGANPGPAAYRRGGPLTVTDANIMLGKLPLFPNVFGPDGNLPLDHERVASLFAELAREIHKETGDNRSPEQVAEGFIEIAVENMAAAIKKISVQKGYDVSDYALCCYGAAAGQHACAVAERLGMRRIILHPFAGVLSAYGMGLADLRTVKEHALEWLLNDVEQDVLQNDLKQLERAGRDEIVAQGVTSGSIFAVRRLFLRYQGTDTAIAVDFAEKRLMLDDFERQYRRQFGFIHENKAVVVESASVEVIGASESRVARIVFDRGIESEPVIVSEVFFHGRRFKTPIYRREQLEAGCVFDGPVIVIESTSTIVIDPGWRGEVSEDNNLLLTRRQKRQSLNIETATSPDPVLLEIFNKLFISIAEQMGFVLQNTAYSVNIKERLDFSCALFDAQGELIANAPHIPVHLGSMGETVKRLLCNDELAIHPGDVFLVNSPYRGGTHLPDITVITPVFDHGDLLFFTASRGHHADVGGITPGSMPSASRTIAEEGVLSPGMKIVEQGVFLEQALKDWLSSGAYPARNPDQNVADLQAQIAANEKGAQELHKLIGRYSWPVVKAYMQFVQDNAEASVRKVLENLPDGRFGYRLDDGSEIVAQITVDRQNYRACVDFTGTSKQQDSNFNAPSAVCKAAVLYVFRTLVKDDIPLNAGCLKPLDIVIPEGSLLNPVYPAAVVAGNVETSQYIVDALYGALGVLAGSQGTMNNLTLGNGRYQYYETICGGAGAGNGFHGCSGVHTHMTNSRITDPEVLEWRLPVLLEEFSIRTGTGGEGFFNGGDGVLRRIRFLEAMSVNILSSHRRHAPFGLRGGRPGAVGQNIMLRADGRIEIVGGCARIEMLPGDAIQIETPGGGGYGSK